MSAEQETPEQEQGILDELGIPETPEVAEMPEPEQINPETGEAPEPPEPVAAESAEPPAGAPGSEPAGTSEEIAGEQPGAAPPPVSEPSWEERFKAAEARAAELETQLQRETTGLRGTIEDLRGRLREQPAPQPQVGPDGQPVQPEPERIPVEFGEDGKAYVSAEHMRRLAPQPPPQDPRAAYDAAAQSLRTTLIHQDPVKNAQPVNRMFEAFTALNTMTQARQRELGWQRDFRDTDEGVGFIEDQGLAAQIIERFPDVLSDVEDVERLVRAGVNPAQGARHANRLIARYHARAAATTPGNGAPAVETPNASPPPATPTTPRPDVPGERPPKMSDVGDPNLPKQGDEIAQLLKKADKDPMSLTDKEMKRLAEHAEKVAGDQPIG